MKTTKQSTIQRIFAIFNFRFLPLFLFLLSIGFSACKSDPCDTVNCQNGGQCIDGTCACGQAWRGVNCETPACDVIICSNGGTCNNGICTCPLGYYGSTCGQRVVDRFAGTYNAAESCTGSGNRSYIVTISAGATITQMHINGLYGWNQNLNATITDQSNFNIPQQTCASGQIYGSGSLAGTTVALDFNWFAGPTNIHCTATLTP